MGISTALGALAFLITLASTVYIVSINLEFALASVIGGCIDASLVLPISLLCLKLNNKIALNDFKKENIARYDEVKKYIENFDLSIFPIYSNQEAKQTKRLVRQAKKGLSVRNKNKTNINWMRIINLIFTIKYDKNGINKICHFF